MSTNTLAHVYLYPSVSFYFLVMEKIDFEVLGICIFKFIKFYELALKKPATIHKSI